MAMEGGLEAGYGAQEGRFASAVRSDETRERATRQVGTDVAADDVRAIASREMRERESGSGGHWLSSG